MSKKVTTKSEVTTNKWEHLDEPRGEIARLIYSQFLLISRLSDAHKEDIEKDTEIKEAIIGFEQVLLDLSNEARVLALKHATETEEKDAGEGLGKVKIATKFLTGEVEPGSDDEFTYLGIAAEYITLLEKITFVTSTGYLDIFTRLKVDTKDMVKIMEDGAKEIKEAVDGMYGEQNGK